MADRTQRVDGIGEVGDSRVPVHKHMAGAHSRVVVDRSWEADRSREVGRSRVATRKRAAVAHNRAAADHTRAAGRSRVETHKHMATAHNRVAVQPCPGLRHDEEMRPSRTALRRRQSLRKDGA